MTKMIHWKKKINPAKKEAIRVELGAPRYTTINGETPWVDTPETIAIAMQYQREGLIEIRNK